jgi:hypothetical protein
MATRRKATEVRPSVVVGDIGHFVWQGRCRAAIVTDVLDDSDDLVSVNAFVSTGSVGTLPHPRSEQGVDDLQYHSKDDCPYMEEG